MTKNLIIIRSRKGLEDHVSTLPLTPDVNVWWKCPNCGKKNYGLLLGKPVQCPECLQYDHPPAGTGGKSAKELQIEEIVAEISELDDQLDCLMGEVGDIEWEIRKKRKQIECLKEEDEYNGN